MRRACASFLVVLILCWSAPASAFTTRVHIVLANEIRDALVASGDGTIRLRWSEATVRIPQVDADAIVNQPLAFRAGAVGPDNTVFPAVTDGTHSVHQDPYRQCELLYLEAFTEAERAYALGCFLHGATDAVAHHFVNGFTGETFTLTPLSSNRTSHFSNVVGHMVTESAIQGAWRRSDPSAFNSASLEHRIPQDFVLRTYFDVDSPVWQRMARDPMSRWEAARTADPSGNLTTWSTRAGFSTWEYLAMAPQYVNELERLRVALRTTMQARITTLAASPSVDARPGPDGVIGTVDDVTACSASCPREFGEYWILVRLLAPRFDTRGNPLPSAFDKISEDLGANLYEFMPALVEVIQRTSTDLNAGIANDADHGLDINPIRLAANFAPIDDWADRTLAIDWTSAGRAVSPEWYTSLSDFLAMFSVRVTVADILALLFEPIIDEIREVLLTQVRGRAEQYVDELKGAYESDRPGWESRFDDELSASGPPTLAGHVLENIENGGLLAYAFNLTAASLANREVLLVDSDPIEHGPASFDASYTPEWTQVALCSYLRDSVFPQGTGLRPLLSVQVGGTFHAAVMPEDSPVECHGGSLMSFGDPNAENCEHTDLASLTSTTRGSLSRAYPPELAAGNPRCRGLIVPGLPLPPVMPDAGMMTQADSGPRPVDSGPLDSSVSPDGAMETPIATPSSCGCTVAGAKTSSSLSWLALALGTLLVARRRRLGVLASCALVGCGAPSEALPDGGVDVSAMPDAALVQQDDAGLDAAALPDAATPMDAPDMTRERFLASLDGTVWNARQTRTESAGDLERAYELHFSGGSEPMWGEIRNPYGPARLRVLRFMRIGRGACSSERRCEIATTVTIPDATWETPSSLRGDMETFTMEIREGSPRTLSVTSASTGIEEVYQEGAWPAPTRGLTAEVRVFRGGSDEPISDAFCTSGAIFSSDINRPVLWDFARGVSTEPTLGFDVAAGVPLGEWNDVDNRFGVRDVDGFGPSDLGGSERTDQFYFLVRYRGFIDHPGGRFQIREEDDSVEDAVWAFAGAGVGGRTLDDLFLEVHHFPPPDETSDAPSRTLSAGEVPIEIIIPRCEMAFTSAGQVRVEMRLGGGAYGLVMDQPVRPLLDATLFPPVL